MVGFDAMNGHEGEFIVIFPRPLQNGCLRIPKQEIRHQTSWVGREKCFWLKAQNKMGFLDTRGGWMD